MEILLPSLTFLGWAAVCQTEKNWDGLILTVVSSQFIRISLSPSAKNK